MFANLPRKQLGFILVILSLLISLPLEAFAAPVPWEPYNQYLPDSTPVAKRHLRGVWISTVINLDWPSKSTTGILNDAQRIMKSKEELAAILDRAVEMNMNAVFLQVSPEGDALYNSKITNWSRYLTGTFGKDPGFDPLAYAVEEAHKRNLEIHAWFNPYRISMDTKDATKESLMIEKSVYKEHPDWIKTSAARFVLDPGIPEARKWVEDRVMEVVNNYDIDGIHFDDYFYYENYVGELKDTDTYNKYNKGQFSNLGDWRRNNTYLLIKELSQKIREAKSWVKFGVSPGGVWGNERDLPSRGSNTNTSFTNYGAAFADTKKWVEEELLDYIAPQIYFSFGNARVPYGELASWWAQICREKNVHLYIGQALYKINDDSDALFKGANAVPEFLRQLKFNITKPEIQGSILFRYQNLNDKGKQEAVTAMKEGPWASKALVPAMPWKGGKAPGTPVSGKVSASSAGTVLTWKDSGPNTAYYAVYRFNKGEKGDVAAPSSGTKLMGTVRKKGGLVQDFTDKEKTDPSKVFYVVTALDRLHNESEGLVLGSNRPNLLPNVGMKYFWGDKVIEVIFKQLFKQ